MASQRVGHDWATEQQYCVPRSHCWEHKRPWRGYGGGVGPAGQSRIPHVLFLCCCYNIRSVRMRLQCSLGCRVFLPSLHRHRNMWLQSFPGHVMKQKLCDAGTAPRSDLGSHGTLHIGESPRNRWYLHHECWGNVWPRIISKPGFTIVFIIIFSPLLWG